MATGKSEVITKDGRGEWVGRARDHKGWSLIDGGGSWNRRIRERMGLQKMGVRVGQNGGG